MKKILSVLLAMAMIFSVMAAGVVNASAASPFAGAKTLKESQAVSYTTKKEKTFYFKINLSSSGTIVFHAENDSYAFISLLDSKGDTVISEGGLLNRRSREYRVEKKGTYYIKLHACYYNIGWYLFENFYYTFDPDAEPTISIGVYMDVGDTLNVAALASNYDGKVTWKTTKKAVATISKGKIKAKKAGKARIRAYMDNGEYAEIVVIVKDEDDD